MSNHVCFLSSGKRSPMMMYSTLAMIIYMATWRYVMFSLLLKSFILLFPCIKEESKFILFLNRLNGRQTMIQYTPIHNMNKNIPDCSRRSAAVHLCVISLMWLLCEHYYIKSEQRSGLVLHYWIHLWMAVDLKEVQRALQLLLCLYPWM